MANDGTMRLHQAPRPGPARWLWPGRVPEGYAWLVAGKPGSGKSSFAASVVASLVSGRPFPDGQTPPKTGPVLYLGNEDHPGDLRDRLAAAGAGRQLRRVVLMTTAAGGEELDLGRADHLNQLAAVMRRVRPIAVVVDPVQGFIPVDGRSRAVRRTMRPFLALMEQHGATPILIAHPTKASATSKTDPLYYAAGSSALPELIRACSIVGSDPTEPALRVVAWAKLQKATLPGSLSFTLTGTAASNPVAGEWAPSARTADELMALNADEQDRMSEARTWLRGLFASRQPITAADVLAAARRDGIAPRTLSRARGLEGIRSQKLGATWVWSPA